MQDATDTSPDTTAPGLSEKYALFYFLNVVYDTDKLLIDPIKYICQTRKHKVRTE